MTAQNQSIFEKYQSAPKWAAGLLVGPSVFHGDADELKPKISFGINLKYAVSYRFALKTSFVRGKLGGARGDFSQYGDDDKSQAKNGTAYSFENAYSELALVGEYNFGSLSFSKINPKWQHYILFGLGSVWSDTKGGFEDGAQVPSFAQNEPAGFHDYSGRNLFVPLGIGVRYKLSRSLDLGLEYRYIQTRSDYLDGFSYSVIENKTKDSYSRLGIELSYKFKSDENQDNLDWANPVESVLYTVNNIEKQKSLIDSLFSDDDQDGVSNYYDKEPNTPKGANTWANGVSADIDQDGIPDSEDQELFSEKNAEVDDNGRMIDVDHDGVPDYRDSDLQTPKGALVDRNGKEIPLSNSTTEQSGSHIPCEDMIFPSVQFANNSSRITYESHGLLLYVADKMRSCPQKTITLTAYSYRNKHSANLGNNRIEALIDYFNSQYNIPRDRFIVKISEEYGSKSSEKRSQIDLN